MAGCDVLIVGGGPAGAACAWRLRHSGLDVVVADAATFPRDKVCAGWITPQVVADLQIDTTEYQKTRVLQEIIGFRVGIVGSESTCETNYQRPVSFAVRRCEFDQFLLQRSGARVRCGARVTDIHRTDRRWVVDGALETPMLVGAGGHWCPVARFLNERPPQEAVVAAQESECVLDRNDSARCRIDPGIVEIYFLNDLSGYGWCFRKGNYLNVGFGRYGARALPQAATEFIAFLQRIGRVPRDLVYRWRGHAYSTASRPRLVGDGVLLIGDAAGVADSRSGEGIRQAIESGLLAGSAIVDASENYTTDRLAEYEVSLRHRFDPGSAVPRRVRDLLSTAAAARVAARLLRAEWFVRRVVLDRWFLHMADPPLAAWPAV